MQRVGFAATAYRYTMLWALTPLFSPLPYPLKVTPTRWVLPVPFPHSRQARMGSPRYRHPSMLPSGDRAVLFLWYFPYPCGRSPLATTLLCVARTFLLHNKRLPFRLRYIIPLLEQKIKGGAWSHVNTFCLCSYSIFAVTARCVVFDVFNDFRGNISTGNLFYAKTWRSVYL